MRIAILSNNVEGMLLAAQILQGVDQHEVLLFCPPPLAEAAKLWVMPVAAVSELEELQAWAPEMCAVLSPELAEVPNILEEASGKKLKVFGFSPLTKHLKFDPVWGVNLLKRLGQQVLPFHKVDNAEDFRRWVITQSSNKVSFSSPHLPGRTTQEFDSLGAAMRASEEMRYPGVARSLDDLKGGQPLQLALLFSGKHAVKPAYVIAPSKLHADGAITGVEVKPLELNDTLNKLTKKLEEVFLSLRYVGFVFLDVVLVPGTSRNPVKLEVVNMSTEAPSCFWSAYSRLLGGTISKVLISCAKGVAFTPKLAPYAYAYSILSSRWMYREADGLHPLFAEVEEGTFRHWDYFADGDQHLAYKELAGVCSGVAKMGDSPCTNLRNTQCAIPWADIRHNVGLVAKLAEFGLHLMLKSDLLKLEEDNNTCPTMMNEEYTSLSDSPPSSSPPLTPEPFSTPLPSPVESSDVKHTTTAEVPSASSSV